MEKETTTAEVTAVERESILDNLRRTASIEYLSLYPSGEEKPDQQPEKLMIVTVKSPDGKPFKPFFAVKKLIGNREIKTNLEPGADHFSAYFFADKTYFPNDSGFSMTLKNEEAVLIIDAETEEENRFWYDRDSIYNSDFLRVGRVFWLPAHLRDLAGLSVSIIDAVDAGVDCRFDNNSYGFRFRVSVQGNNFLPYKTHVLALDGFYLCADADCYNGTGFAFYLRPQEGVKVVDIKSGIGRDIYVRNTFNGLNVGHTARVGKTRTESEK